MKPMVIGYWDRLTDELYEAECGNNEKEILRLTDIQDSVKKIAQGITHNDSVREVLLGELIKQIKNEISVD